MEESSSFTSLAALANSHLEKQVVINGVNENPTIIGHVDTSCLPFLNPNFIPKQRFVIPKLNMGSQTSHVEKVVANQIAEKLRRNALELEREEQLELEKMRREQMKIDEETRVAELLKALTIPCKGEVKQQPVEDYEEFEIQFIDSDFAKPAISKERPQLPCLVVDKLKPRSKYAKSKCSSLGWTICAAYNYKFIPYFIPTARNENVKRFQFDKPSPDDFVQHNLMSKKAVSETVFMQLFKQASEDAIEKLS